MLNKHIDLKGKTAVVTGASKGIGEAAVRRLAQANANVVLLARSSERINSIVDSIVDSIGDNSLALVCDVADWNSVKSTFAQATERFGSIDILVNNAGLIDPIARIEDADPIAWGRVVDVNLKGVFHCIHAALPSMKRNGGTIINMSSGAATSALEAWSHYCTTKAAVLSLTKCVHKECAENGIRCVGLSPGTVATDMQRSIRASMLNPVSQLNWSEHIPAEWVGEAIVWLCTEAAKNFDGQDFSLKNDAGRRAIGLPTQ